jgi:hypothetical protein
MSFIDTINTTISNFFGGTPTSEQQQQIAAAVVDFPKTFDRAVNDWAKFKAGVQAGLFTTAQRQEALEWFKEFPKLWETVRPNFIIQRTASGAYLPLGPAGFADKVDKWVARLQGSVAVPGLGIAPLIVAGVIIAGALGLAGAFWAVAYIQRQAVISKMIDEVTAGRLSESVLNTALQNEASFMSPIGEVGSVVKWLAVGLAAYFILPTLAESLRGKKN